MSKIKSFAFFGNKLSRVEMKNVFGGVDDGMSLPDGRDGGSDGTKKCGSCYSAYDCGSKCNVCTGRMDGSGIGDCGK